MDNEITGIDKLVMIMTIALLHMKGGFDPSTPQVQLLYDLNKREEPKYSGAEAVSMENQVPRRAYKHQTFKYLPADKPKK